VKTWYDIKASATPQGRAQVFIYGDIGDWGVTADQFRRDLQAVGNGPLDVRITSNGGSVYEAIAMHTLLSMLPDVHTYGDGAVASAATLPFIAGKKRTMALGSALFVHNPWDISAGNAGEMRKVADALDVASVSLANLYAKATGQTVEVIKALMDGDTWMGAERAKELGFATDIGEQSTVQARVQAGRYRNVPQNVTQFSPPVPNDQMKHLTTALAKAGLLASADVAEDAAVEQLTNRIKARDDAQASLTGERDTLKTERDELKTRLDSVSREFAKATADAAVKDGRITDGVRAKWEDRLVADPKNTLELLKDIAPKAHGHRPIGSGGDGKEKPKTMTEQSREEIASRATR